MTTAAPGSVGIVGRNPELAWLRQELDGAIRGGLRVALVTGHPGIGKTRLVRQLAEEARGAGVNVSEAAASSLDSGLAYACLLPALERLVDQDGAALEELPQLVRLFPDRVGTRTSVPTPVADPALEKTLLFEAVVRLVQRVTATRPFLLSVDDLHWADRSTLELLHYMARRLADEPMMMLLARRAAVAETGAALRELIGGLERTARTVEVTLSELDDASVMLLAAGLLGGEPPDGLEGVLRLRSAGVPLAVEGVVRALLHSGALHRTARSWVLDAIPSPLPNDLRQMVLARLDHLSPGARALVDLTSVSGGVIDDEVLAAIATEDRNTLDEAMVAAVDAGVLNPVAEARLALAHPMFQEVAYAELRPSRRAQLHARLAATLDRLTPEDVAARSLHHRGAGAAGDDAAALDVFLAAADLAARRSAPADASQQLTAALAVLRRGHRIDLLVDVLERLGEMQMLAGDLEAAVQAWAAALEACGAGSPHGALQEARLHRRLAQAERDRGRVAEAEMHVQAGFAMLPDSGDSQERADLHHAAILVTGARDDHAEKLVELADRLGTPRARVQARLAALALNLARGDLQAARAQGEAAIAAAERSGDPLLTNRAQSEMCLALLCLGDPAGLREHSTAGLEAARRVGAPPLEAQIRRALMLSDLVAGDLDQAVVGGDEAVDSARRFAPGRTLANNLIYRGWARLLVGDEPGAAADLDDAVAALQGQVPDNRTYLGLGLLGGRLAMARGDVSGALAAAARFAPNALDPAAGHGLLDIRLPWGLALLAEAQVAAGAFEGALTTAVELERLGRGGAIGACFSLRARGAAAAASGDARGAIAMVDDALAVAEALGAGHEAAWTMLAGAEAAAAAGSPEAADRAIAATLRFDMCGARRDAERARRLVRRLGATPPQPSRRRARQDAGLLRGRELEVAQLVAEGLTNAAIAERLFLSPRTVASHLDHMYTRLGIRSRAALARRVTELRSTAETNSGAA